jgi:hypothetical protein
MKKILLSCLVALVGCASEDPSPITGKWSFTTDQFSGEFTVDNDGNGTGTFTIRGIQYTAINTDIRRGTSVVMYSENEAYIGLHQITQPVSKYQEFREPGPSPFEKEVRHQSLILTP